MKKKEELFYLIKSLSKSEKRHFKLQHHRSNSNYLRLFDAIDKQQIYDEQRIKDQFANERFTKQLHSSKNHLRQLIYQSLRQYHKTISIDAQVKDLLRTVEILYQKELLQHAEQELNKAHRLAVDYELDVIIIEIKRWQRILLQARQPNHHAAIKDLLDQESTLVENLQRNFQQWQLIIQSIGGGDKAMLKRLSEQIKQTNHEKLSVHAKVLHACTQAHLSLYKNDVNSVTNVLNDAIQAMQNAAHLLHEKPQPYVALINNLAYFHAITQEHEKALSLLDLALKLFEESQSGNNNKLLVKEIARSHLVELDIYLQHESPEEYLTKIQANTQFCKNHQHQLPDDYKVRFYYQLGLLYFKLNNDRQALHWLGKLISCKASTYLELHFNGRLLNLMIHARLKNYIALGYFATNTRRFFRQHKLLKPWVRRLLLTVEKLGQHPESQLSRVYQQLHLRLFPENSVSIVPETTLKHIPIENWLTDLRINANSH